MLKEQLSKVYELLEAGWCQGTYAKDSAGNHVSPHVISQASCFCLTGACYHVSYSEPEANALFAAIGEQLGNTIGCKGALVRYNDTHTKAEVLALVAKARDAA